MAFMNQELKKEISGALTNALKGSGLKYTLSTDRYSITMTIQSGPVDFFGSYEKKMAARKDGGPEYYRNYTCGYFEINNSWYSEHFTDEVCVVLKKIYDAINIKNFDKSDITTDFFHVGYYVNVLVGKYGKPYKLTTC